MTVSQCGNWRARSVAEGLGCVETVFTQAGSIASFRACFYFRFSPHGPDNPHHSSIVTTLSGRWRS
jgi:hypothetical protein